MKAKILKEDFQKALSQASKFTSQKAQLPILQNILLEAKKTSLVLSSTNLETSFQTTLGAKTEKEGSLSVPAKTLLDLVTNLSSQQIDLEASKEALKISSQNFSSNLAGLNSSDFPSLPNPKNSKSLSLPSSLLQKALSQTLFSVSRDETRPTLTGILFIFSSSALTLASSDGFRLTTLTLPIKSPFKASLIVPRNTLSELQRMLPESDSPVKLSYSKEDNQLTVFLENTTLSTRLIEGSFPDFEKIIPSSSQIKANVGKQDLLEAVKLASVIARQSTNTIKLHVQKDTLTLFSQSQDKGDQKSTIPAKVDGGELEISFNCRFIEEFLSISQDESVSLEFNNPASPGVFKDPKNPDLLHLIMPIKAD
jgi:DNA polymerase-3 subunit beta